MSIQPVNLSNFENGHLKFKIKIPSNISFQIGIIDAWGNQSYVNFPANQTAYGLTRNGDWGQVSIPISDIRGELIDLRMLSYEFVILEVNGASCQFALDDIFWDGGTTENLLGDLNDDDNIDILDIILIVGIILDNSGYNPIADFNSDSVIDVMDIVQIIGMILN